MRGVGALSQKDRVCRLSPNDGCYEKLHRSFYTAVVLYLGLERRHEDEGMATYLANGQGHTFLNDASASRYPWTEY